MLKKIIAFLLVLSTLFLVACAGDGDGDKNVTTSGAELDDTKYINITEGELSDYVIVTPRGKSDIFLEAYALAKSIKEVSGADLKIYQDTYKEQEKEIDL